MKIPYLDPYLPLLALMIACALCSTVVVDVSLEYSMFFVKYALNFLPVEFKIDNWKGTNESSSIELRRCLQDFKSINVDHNDVIGLLELGKDLLPVINLPSFAFNNYLRTILLSEDEFRYINMQPHIVPCTSTETYQYSTNSLHTYMWKINGGESISVDLYEPLTLATHSIKLRDDSVLFIPHSFNYKISCTDKSHVYSVMAVRVLDASNLHLFESTLSSTSYSVLKQLKIPLKLDRYPISLTASQYLGLEAVPTSSSMKRKSLTDWQIEAKWNRLISSLTLPSIEKVDIQLLHRKKAEISLWSEFTSTHGDSLEFSFETNCQPNLLIPTESMIDIGYSTDVRRDVYRHSVVLVDLNHDLDYNCTYDDDVSIENDYDVRFKVVYNDGRGPESDPIIFHTLPNGPPSPPTGKILASQMPCIDHNDYSTCSTHCQLQFGKSLNNGGKDISHVIIQTCRRVAKSDVCDGYHDFKSLSMEQFQQHEVNVVLSIGDLLPSFIYSFQIAYQNEFGVGNYSQPSNQVLVTRHQAGGGSIMIDSSSQANLNHRSSKMTLDTLHQSISLNQAVRLDAWNCYFSPPSLVVTSSIHWSSEWNKLPITRFKYHNTDATIFGKIVISPRDGTTFAVKARKFQSQGAVGLVIIDLGSSSCNADVFNQACLPGANKNLNELWGRLDSKTHWKDVHIPVMFVLQSALDSIQQQVSDLTGDDL